MPWNERSAFDWSLYVILDADVLAGRDPVEAAKAAIQGGADVLQYRAKRSAPRTILAQLERLQPICAEAKVPLIVNDHLDLALAAQATGVHLGQDDLPLSHARHLAGDACWLGRSTHSFAQAEQAARDGATYIAVGPVFPTPTKPDAASVGLALIRQVAPCLTRPWLAIGGIDLTNVEQVLEAGATRVAVVRAVVGASDIEQATRALKQRLLHNQGVSPPGCNTSPSQRL